MTPGRTTMVAGVLLGVLLVTTPAFAVDRGSLVRVSRDPFEHTRSEVEPATFAYGHTAVSAFQVGRLDAGAMAIGYAASTNNAMTWTSGLLRGSAAAVGGAYERASDPSVAYDARTRTWFIAYLALTFGGPFEIPIRSAVQIVRSKDGVNWLGQPITVAKAPKGMVYDKPWVACDSGKRSPYLGRCYAVWSASGLRGGPYARILLATSRNGGMDWGRPVRTAGVAEGVGALPVVRPDGTVVVPFLSTRHPLSPSFASFRSTDGGRSWTHQVVIAKRERAEPPYHFVRDPGFPSVAIDSSGTAYVAWSDCRFRARCSGNDIVVSTSSDGRHWADPRRIASGRRSSLGNLLTPALAVRERGRHIALALTYYALSNGCVSADCSLIVRYSSSRDGIRRWTRPVALSERMRLDRFPGTRVGYMWGDYVTAATLGNGRAVMVIPLVRHRAARTDVAMYAPHGGLEIGGA